MKLIISKPFYFSTGELKYFITTSIYIDLKMGYDKGDIVDEDMLNNLRIYRR